MAERNGNGRGLREKRGIAKKFPKASSFCVQKFQNFLAKNG
jgi:hypothetical protein